MSVTEPSEEMALQHKTVLLDHLNLISQFNGTDEAVSFSDFISSFLGIADFLQWDERDRIFALKNRVTGEAARIIKNQSASKSFEDLKNLLKERFTKSESPTDVLQRFMAYKQMPGMGVREFFEKASDLSHKALVFDGCDKEVAENSRKALLKAMLLQNLAPEIRKGVVSKDPQSPDQILEFALLEERGWNSIRENNDRCLLPPPNVNASKIENLPDRTYACAIETDRDESSEIRELKSEIRKLKKELSKVSMQTNQVPEEGAIQCFYCAGWNHYARNCPQKMRDKFSNLRGSSRENYGLPRFVEHNFAGTHNQPRQRYVSQNWESSNMRPEKYSNYKREQQAEIQGGKHDWYEQRTNTQQTIPKSFQHDNLNKRRPGKK